MYRIHSVESTARASHPGRPVVLIPGLGVSGRYYHPAAAYLAAHYPTYVPDLPGFGWSDKPAQALTLEALAEVLSGWLAVLRVRDVTMVGNSMGCQLAIRLAQGTSVPVRGLVLAAPTMDRSAPSPLRQIWRALQDVPRESPGLIRLAACDYLRAGLGRDWRCFREALADPVEERVRGLRTPALVVRGSADPIVSRRWAEHLASLLARGRYVEIPGGTHAAHYTAPAAFVRAIMPFLATL